MRTRAIAMGTWVACTLAACSSGPAAGAAEPTATSERRSEMMVIRVVVDVRPEQVDAFVSHMRTETLQVRALEGCQRYELYRDPDGSGRFLLYEEWSSPEAFEAYRGSAMLRESFAVLGPMMARPPDSAYFEVRQASAPR